jgi:hypothetical protein
MSKKISLALLAFTLTSCAPTADALIDKFVQSTRLYNKIYIKDADELKDADKNIDDALATKSEIVKELEACDAEDLKKIEKDIDCSNKIYNKHVQDMTIPKDDELKKECPSPNLAPKCQEAVNFIRIKFAA